VVTHYGKNMPCHSYQMSIQKVTKNSIISGISEISEFNIYIYEGKSVNKSQTDIG
jgi:hypothetical protein